MFEVASEIAHRDPILQRLVPIMISLRDETGETVIAGKRQGDEVIYLEVIEGTHLIRYRENAGSRKPLHSSSIGKAMLGSLDQRQLTAFLKGRKLAKMTDRTIVDTRRLLEELETSQKRGYYTTSGENVADVQAFSIVCKVGGETLAIALAGPIERMRAKEQVYVPALRAARQKMEGLYTGAL
jgi:DNA-binding IclR family transcriptional regulator